MLHYVTGYEHNPIAQTPSLSEGGQRCTRERHMLEEELLLD
jgi:hypothetical protein